jgi:plastocyanin
MRILSLLLAAGALAFASGCGDDDDNGDSSGAATPPPAATTPAESGGTVEIHMKDFQFDPTTQTVKVGQTIKWTNDDTADHNVVATKGEDFKSDNFGKGGTFEYKVDKAGTIDYVCTLHSNMKATLTVE